MKEECAVIIGAASGIGKEITIQVSKEYPTLKLILVDKEKIKISNLNDVCYILDLNMKSEVKEFISFLEQFDIKFLINSAGYQENVDILNITTEEWEKMYNVTVSSIFQIEQLVAKNMINNEVDNKSIVNITSIHSNIIRGIAHYSSAKASLDMITKEFAYYLSKYNIRVNSVLPGSIDTPLLRKDLNSDTLLSESAEKIPLNRHGKPIDVANLVMFLISEKAGYITGNNIVIAGGLSLVI
ncbi:MAG: SDR family oxidoreductase [Oscillospiraceae bacterium]|nr:SDR family oxidoreductase [Oscillospiraceae bacterium]